MPRSGGSLKHGSGRLLPALATLVQTLASCETSDDPRAESIAPPADTAAGVVPFGSWFTVSGPPDVRGVITEIDGDTLLVEAIPEADSGTPKARVAIQMHTGLWRGWRGPPVDRAELQVGQHVSLWLFDRVILPIYPLTGTAAAIVIEGDSLQPQRPSQPAV